MLNTICLTSLHKIQQDLINFIPGFSSLLMLMIFFLLLKQTVPNSDMRYFRTSVIYVSTNPMVIHELMRIRHTGKPKMGILANKNEEPDETSQNMTFHQGLQCLLKIKDLQRHKVHVHLNFDFLFTCVPFG